MPAILNRTDIASLVGAQNLTDVLGYVARPSLALSTFPSQPVNKAVVSVPMLSGQLATASFTGEADGSKNATTAADGRKALTKPFTLLKRSMRVEEIATIVKVHESVIADADSPEEIVTVINREAADAVGATLDAAVFYGVGAPASWPAANIVGQARAAGNARVRGSVAGNDLADDFNGVLSALENDGFEPSNVFAVKTLKAKFRGMRDANGRPLYLAGVRDDGATDSIFDLPLSYLDGANSRPSVAEAIALDRTSFRLGIRQDLTVKYLDQATLDNGDGTSTNLAQDGMVAYRFVFRVSFGAFIPERGHQLGDYPAAVLTAA